MMACYEKFGPGPFGEGPRYLPETDFSNEERNKGGYFDNGDLDEYLGRLEKELYYFDTQGGHDLNEI
ncbi:unnamed protein product [Phytomonas sp. Hart1]|nr:unnamed protein product [Phytomonas sp. Hart1]|eukprot:CCW68840.1 unnamed protein product [Phytomonas sp. isolate Hart1]